LISLNTLAKPLKSVLLLGFVLLAGQPGVASSPSSKVVERDYQKLVTQVARQFWGEFEGALSLLPNNYVPRIHDGQIDYQYLGSEQVCPEISVKQPDVVAAVEYNVSQDNGKKRIKLSYIGCDGSPFLYEIIQFKEPLAPELSLPSFVLGQRDFVATKERPWVSVQYMDAADQLVGSVESAFLSREMKTTFYIVDRPIAELTAKPRQNLIEITAYSYDLDFKLARPKVALRSKSSLSASPANLDVIFEGENLKRFEYRGTVSHDLPEKSFNLYFDSMVLKATRNTLGGLFGFIAQNLPKTAVSVSGGANERFLKELVVLDQRLKVAGPADIDFVQTQIKSMINSINTGEIVIIDKRKK